VRFHHFIAVTWLVFVCAITPTHAEKRVALVIGNDRYANLGANEQLQKAVNDAHAVGAALAQLQFDVMSAENAGRAALVDKLDAFTQRLAPGDTAFFFFSGHGVAIGGVNFILPSDIPNIGENQESRLAHAAFSEQDIVADLKARGVRVAVLVLDACRTNPFAKPGTRGVGGTRGLAPPAQVQGVFSLYSAAAGQMALDRLGDGDPNPNSVFSRVPVPRLTKPGLDLRDLAYEVREEVARIAATAGHDQRPASYDETIGGRIYLAGPPPAGGQVIRPVSPPGGDAAQAWRDIQGTASLAVLDDFIRRFGDAPIYGPRARERRDELKQTPAQPQPQVAMADRPERRDGVPLTAVQERGLRPKDTFRECENCPEMVTVPAGSFTMGSPSSEKLHESDESPLHLVTISKPFAVGKLHVTVDQFAAFVREAGYEASTNCLISWLVSDRKEGSWRDPGFAQEGSHPVVCVSWDDANAYAKWLAKKTGKPYRLLSEAEWEYAARSRTSPGTYPSFWFGDDGKDICRYGNIDASICDDGYKYTSPAGHYPPNAFGLYDMAGNAHQWTADCYHNTYTRAPIDGSAWATEICNSGRVVRGGSWGSPMAYLRAAHRMGYPHGDVLSGFRLARTLIP
jgi:formylglycine-generating enzyme required for sulfatase activity